MNESVLYTWDYSAQVVFNGFDLEDDDLNSLSWV